MPAAAYRESSDGPSGEEMTEEEEVPPSRDGGRGGGGAETAAGEAGPGSGPGTGSPGSAAAALSSYPAVVPVTPHGLLLRLSSRPSRDGPCLQFGGYQPDPVTGAPGPAETGGGEAFRSVGDVVTHIEGRPMTGLDFREEILPYLRRILAEEGREAVTMTATDGTEWWRRRREEEEREKEEAREEELEGWWEEGDAGGGGGRSDGGGCGVVGDEAPASMALTDAYEAMEGMRRLNLEVEFAERIAAGATVDLKRCTACLRAELGGGPGGRRKEPFDGRRVRRLLRKTGTGPCLVCWAPVCSRHADASFREEGITVCGECAHLFSLDFIVGCVEEAEEDGRGGGSSDSLSHLVDIYDRVLLMLRFSLRFADDVADSLERKVRNKHATGLAGNATGLVSGITGIAAAAAIFTPAGPGLIIASLLFGGTATAVSTGGEAAAYFSDSRRLADRILALHGVAASLLRIKDVLRDALLRDHIRVDHFLEDGDADSQGGEAAPAVPAAAAATIDQVREQLEREPARITSGAGTAAAKYAGAATEIGALATSSTAKATAAAEAAALAARAEVLAGAEVGVAAARTSRFASRATSTAMRTASFARMFGGAISAAAIVLEVKDMHSTVRQIRSGSPCEKAELVRSIRDEVRGFPETAALQSQCELYSELRSKRREGEMLTERAENAAAGTCPGGEVPTERAEEAASGMYPDVERAMLAVPVGDS